MADELETITCRDAAAWDAWAATLRDLPDDDWRQPTRLGDWDGHSDHRPVVAALALVD